MKGIVVWGLAVTLCALVSIQALADEMLSLVLERRVAIDLGPSPA